MGSVILVSIDFSDVTDLVLDEAARLGKALQSPICLIHAVVSRIAPDFDELGIRCGYVTMQEPAEELQEQLEPAEELQEQLDKLRDKLAAPGLAVSTVLLHGRSVDVIVEEAERLRAELVVLGSHGRRALHHLLAGSVCQGVLRRVACPVVIVPSRMATTVPGAVQAAAPETSVPAM